MRRLTFEQEVELGRKQAARAEMLKKVLDEALATLINTEKYTIRAGDTHRWIDSDGWYELAYYLCRTDGTGEDLYITTYSTHEREFEEEWSTGEYHYDIEPDDIYWYDTYYPSPFRWRLEDLLKTELKNDLPADLVRHIVAVLTKDKLLEEEEKTWVKSLQG